MSETQEMTWLNDEDSRTVVQMHAALVRARRVLLELEWHNGFDKPPRCPLCNAPKERGHYERCRYAELHTELAALSDAAAIAAHHVVGGRG